MHKLYSLFKLWPVAPYHTYQRKIFFDSCHLCWQKGEKIRLFLSSFREYSKVVWTFCFQRTAGRLIFWFRIHFFSLKCTVPLHLHSSSSLGRHGFPSKSGRCSSSTVPTPQLSLLTAQCVKFAAGLSELNHLLWWTWQECSMSLRGFLPGAYGVPFIKMLQKSLSMTYLWQSSQIKGSHDSLCTDTKRRKNKNQKGVLCAHSLPACLIAWHSQEVNFSFWNSFHSSDFLFHLLSDFHCTHGEKVSKYSDLNP